MALEQRNYDPALMQGASVTLGDDLSVTDTLTVSGVSTLAAVTSSGTLTAVKLVITQPASASTAGVGLDLSSVLGSQSAIKFVAATETPVAASGTTVNTGWLKVNVAGTARYIPFHT